MDEYRERAFDLLLSSCTEHRTDRQRALIAFQACNTPSEIEYVKEIYLSRRFAWIDKLSVWQRKWQSKVSKNPWKGNHYDSWATRESYIRCHGDYHDYLEMSGRKYGDEA